MIYVFGTPEETAQALADTDLNAMLEACWQALHGGYPGEWSQWAKVSYANFKTLVTYAMACCDEYSYRVSSVVCSRCHTGNENREKFWDTTIPNCQYCGGLMAFDTKHKRHDLIYRHIPIIAGYDVSSCAGTEQRCTPDCTGSRCYWDTNTTPMPLPPKEYWAFTARDDGYLRCAPDVFLSYRAMYRRLLKRSTDKKCETCGGTGAYPDVASGCYDCSSTGYILTTSTYTRRKPPNWLV